MSKVGHDSGSEFHLQRLLKYHRPMLDWNVGTAVDGEVRGWLDAPPVKSETNHVSSEWKALEFLASYASADAVSSKAIRDWRTFWPQTGNAQRWDAVGRVRVGGEDSWLLVEAKSHVREIKAACRAGEKSAPVIASALDITKRSLGISAERDWMQPYYQFCNRLAVLDFLARHGVSARLLFIYFLGDKFPAGRSVNCPVEAAGWQPGLAAMYEHVGWNDQNPLFSRVHSLFLQVEGQ